MRTLGLWPLRALWILIPFTTGALVDHALDGRLTSFRIGATAIFWTIWALVLVAMLVPRVETLTAVRIAVPAAPVAALWATAATEVDDRAITGIVVALVAAIGVLLAPVGEAFVDGSSYGDERRMPLRPPVAVLAGPVPLAWAVTVAGSLTGPLLLLAHQWIAGLLVTAAGLLLAGVAVRALHQLSRRWVVFVPAGFVLHDHLALREPVLFTRNDLVALGPAPADTRAHDLTARAAGLALQVDFAVPVEVVPTTPGEQITELVGITQFLFMPSRPGEVLREAERRRLRVAR
jgi:hypothetical protein